MNAEVQDARYVSVCIVPTALGHVQAQHDDLLEIG